MNIKKIFIYLSLSLNLCFNFNLIAKINIIGSNEESLIKIQELVKNYKRHITILEICLDNPKFIFKLAASCDSTCNVISLKGDDKKIVKQIRQDKFNNICLLCPKKITADTFDTLSRCESFDLVIISDIFKFFKEERERLFDVLLTLGDHIFLKLNWDETAEFLSFKNQHIAKMVYNCNKNNLFYAHYEKTYLDIGRFTQYKRPRNPNSPYKIFSDFDKKLFYKDKIENAIEWVPGINLITFTMLYGKYPNDEMIYKNIKNMESSIPYHNDLMIGNMIVQGSKVVAIDFNDKRRNANMKRCIERALAVFNGDNSRLKNPEKRIREYYKKK